jgi:hypothetical protein
VRALMVRGSIKDLVTLTGSHDKERSRERLDEGKLKPEREGNDFFE